MNKRQAKKRYVNLINPIVVDKKGDIMKMAQMVKLNEDVPQMRQQQRK